MATPMRIPRRVHTGSKFELTMWFITRITGVLLLMMGAYSIVYANLSGGYGNMDAGAQMRWAFFPISFHVQSTKVEVTPNFFNAFWQGYAFLLITFAATHAANGLRVVCEDYIRRPLLLAWVKAFVVFLWIAVLLAAIFLLFVFQG